MPFPIVQRNQTPKSWLPLDALRRPDGASSGVGVEISPPTGQLIGYFVAFAGIARTSLTVTGVNTSIALSAAAYSAAVVLGLAVPVILTITRSPELSRMVGALTALISFDYLVAVSGGGFQPGPHIGSAIVVAGTLGKGWLFRKFRIVTGDSDYTGDDSSKPVAGDPDAGDDINVDINVTVTQTAND